MPQFGVSAGLPDTPAGLDDERYGLVTPLYRSLNALGQFVSQYSGNVQYDQGEMAQVDQLVKLLDANTSKVIVQAGATLSYGQMLALKVVGGKITAYVADATNLTLPALAICDTPGGIASGQYGEALFMRGRTFGISGTTFGAAYYLSTSGTVQVVPPVATGVINQVVGVGLGSAGFYLNIEPVGRRPTLVYKFNSVTMRVLYSDGTWADLPV